MILIAQPFNGASYLFRGLEMAMRPKIRRFVVIPLIINVLLFSAGIWYSFSLFSELLDGMLTHICLTGLAGSAGCCGRSMR